MVSNEIDVLNLIEVFKQEIALEGLEGTAALTIQILILETQPFFVYTFYAIRLLVTKCRWTLDASTRQRKALRCQQTLP
jgi:hypothetical protein